MYEKLRAKVYSIIYPDGIPLEFGCEYKGRYYRNDPENKSEFESIIIDDEQIKFLKDGMYKHQNSGSVFFDLKILGKPLDLASILRAIKNVCVRCDTYTDTDNLEIKVVDGNIIELDLSKSISEQEESTLLEIYNLLK